MTDLSPLQRDIDAKNQDIVSKLTNRFKTDANRGELSPERREEEIYQKVTRQPLIDTIHASFYLTVLRTYFPREEQWKSYVKKKLPLYSRYIDHFIIIGKHFQWDESTIKELDAFGYAVPHERRRDSVRNVGSQLDDMRKKGLAFRDQSDLLKKARYEVWPEVDPVHGSAHESVNAEKYNREDKSTDVGENPEFAPHNRNGVTQQDKVSPEPSDTNDIVFNGFIRKLLNQLSQDSLASSVLQGAIEMRSLDLWDKAVLTDVRKALRTSIRIRTSMMDQVLEA